MPPVPEALKNVVEEGAGAAQQEAGGQAEQGSRRGKAAEVLLQAGFKVQGLSEPRCKEGGRFMASGAGSQFLCLFYFRA